MQVTVFSCLVQFQVHNNQDTFTEVFTATFADIKHEVHDSNMKNCHSRPVQIVGINLISAKAQLGQIKRPPYLLNKYRYS